MTSSEGLERYRIVDGVRRAKAHLVLGRREIKALVLDENDIPGEVVTPPIDALFSPKEVIETSGSGYSRWRKIVRAVEVGYFSNGESVPPIKVNRKLFGTPVAEVIVEGEDELERFR